MFVTADVTPDADLASIVGDDNFASYDSTAYDIRDASWQYAQMLWTQCPRFADDEVAA